MKITKATLKDPRYCISGNNGIMIDSENGTSRFIFRERIGENQFIVSYKINNSALIYFGNGQDLYPKYAIPQRGIIKINRLHQNNLPRKLSPIYNYYSSLLIKKSLLAH